VEREPFLVELLCPNHKKFGVVGRSRRRRKGQMPSSEELLKTRLLVQCGGSSGERNLAVVELSAQGLFVGLSGAGLRLCGFVDWR
jgi:hypothetical protein